MGHKAVSKNKIIGGAFMPIFKIEATHGVKVKKDRLIKKNQIIGVAKDFKTQIKSPFDGWVKDIVFDPISHSYLVEIIPVKPSKQNVPP